MMQKSYSEERLAGIRAATRLRKQHTVERLTAAITQLEADGKAVSAKTIRAVSGLEYVIYARNSEALVLFKAHSSALQARRKRKRSKEGEAKGVVNPLARYSKAELMDKLHQEMQRRQEVERWYYRLLEEQVTKDLHIARLEASWSRTISSS